MELHYVYAHIDPETAEWLYVGKGRGGRAWNMARGDNRPHMLWLCGLGARGYTLADVVIVLCKRLTKDEALRLEAEHIRLHLPRFNRYVPR